MKEKGLAGQLSSQDTQTHYTLKTATVINTRLKTATVISTRISGTLTETPFSHVEHVLRFTEGL